MTTLAKGLRVLELFGRERPAMTLSQAAELADMPRATARRILRTLTILGYVQQNGRAFSLSPAILNLGFGWLSGQSWIEHAQAPMRALSEQFGESCSLAILEDVETVYVARVQARRVMQNAIGIGSRLPAFHSSMGRVLLGYLDTDELWQRLRSAKLVPPTALAMADRQALFDRIRDDHAQGYSIVDEEYEKGLRAIAVPVPSRSGAPVAALNLSTHVSRFTRVELRERFLPALLEAAKNIGNMIV